MSRPKVTLEPFQRRLQYRFRDRRLAELALVHRSSTTAHEPATNNERLEFLGDSILGLVVAQWLYQLHPQWTEGQLTKGKSELVSRPALVPVGEALRLRGLIRVGTSQGLDPIPESIVAGTVEAIVGAVFLDGGFAAAERLIRRLWLPQLRAVKHGRRSSDFKSQLQEWCMQHWRVLPQYTVVEESGPPHAREFEIVVKIKGRPYGRARARSKKRAQQLAAQITWQRLKSTVREEKDA